jgi:hypothetical protein
MKRTLVAVILGIALSVTTARGQGRVVLNTYVVNGYMGAPVYYGNAGAGGPVGISIQGVWNVQLAYYVGTGITDPAGYGSLLPVWNLNAAIVNPNFHGGWSWGYFEWSPDYIVPDYPSTGGVPAEVELLVFNGSDYASSTIRGHSAAFTLPAIATGGDYPRPLDGLASFSVYLIPEPSGLALAGLGIGVLAVYRRQRSAR